MGKLKPPKTKPTEPTEVIVTYDLFDLPTAFHKAGLAGLILLIESLKEQNSLTDEQAKYKVSATGATVTFQDSMLRKLMDDLYDARPVEVSVKSKWQGVEAKREVWVEEDVDGKKTRTKRFIYEQVQPKGKFFENVFSGDKELWRKLWRDMLWSIPRGRPTTREPYNQRAAGESCKEGPNAWEELVKVFKARQKGSFHTAELSSALFPGAQAVNAEGVAFEGRAEQNLLLHFWPLTVLVFCPQKLETDGTAEFVGYTLAVPEVSHLTRFIRHYRNLLNDLTKDVRGYRPAQAVIDLPAEGALAFLDHLAALTAGEMEQFQLRQSINSVEFLHLVKEGNNIKSMAAGRVAPNEELLGKYREITCPNPATGRPLYRNPLFRRGLLSALLNKEEWYLPFGRTLATFDVEVFIRRLRRSDDEKVPPQFADDVAAKFRLETKLFTQKFERYANMPDAPRPSVPPSVIVNRVVRKFLLTRTQEKTSIKLKKYKTPDGKLDYKAMPTEFNEAKQKLALSLILEFRSRRDQAFVDHFAGTFFSVTQRLAESDRLELADLLTGGDISGSRRDELKTLTLLSLSANS